MSVDTGEMYQAADPADHAVAQIDDPDLVQVDAERGDEEILGEADGGAEHRLARSGFFEPASEGESGEPETDDRR